MAHLATGRCRDHSRHPLRGWERVVADDFGIWEVDEATKKVRWLEKAGRTSAEMLLEKVCTALPAQLVLPMLYPPAASPLLVASRRRPRYSRRSASAAAVWHPAAFPAQSAWLGHGPTTFNRQRKT